MESSRRRPPSDGLPRSQVEGLDDAAWVDVIRKMDEVYSQLVADEVALEEKNAQLEQSQRFIVSLLSMTAARASVVWSTVQRRENERELVFVGRQFAAAIESYHRARSSAPGPPYPRELEQLLLDDRALAVRRHLRQIYLDPMTGSRQWGLIRLPDGGIVGVHSLSGRAPLQRATLASGLSFPLATSYRDWRFIAPSAAESFAATTR